MTLDWLRWFRRSRSTPPFRIELLDTQHRALIAVFSCGDAAIDAYLKRDALAEQSRRLASVYVAVARAPAAIVGFYTLSALALRVDLAVRSLLDYSGGGPVPYPAIPAYLLGRLGVDQKWQGRGIGEALVAAAFSRAQRLSREAAGGMYLVVDPKTERLVEWYSKLGFVRINPHKFRVAKAL